MALDTIEWHCEHLPDDDPWSATRHDPTHPLWTLSGQTHATTIRKGTGAAFGLFNWIVDEVDDAFPGWRADSQSVNSTTIESRLRARAPG
jgi:hypothetical protein